MRPPLCDNPLNIRRRSNATGWRKTSPKITLRLRSDAAAHAFREPDLTAENQPESRRAVRVDAMPRLNRCGRRRSRLRGLESDVLNRPVLPPLVL